MTKRKYKVFINFVLVGLCLFPLIATLIAMSNSTYFINNVDYNEFIGRFEISNDLSNRIGTAINTFGFDFNGSYFNAVCVLISNSVIIYLLYVFVAVLTFLPKLAIKFINLGKE